MRKKILSLAFEGNEETSAIDRLLDKSGASDDKPLSLSSQILAKREQMIKEAKEESEKIEKEEDNEESSSDDSDGDSDGGDGDDDWDDGDSDGDSDEGGDSDDGDGGDDDWDDDDWDDDDDSDDDDDDSDDDSDDSDDDSEDDDDDKKKDDEDDKKKDDDKKDKKDDDKDKDKDDKESREEKVASSWESNKSRLRGLKHLAMEDIKSNIRLPKGWNIFKPLRKEERLRREFLLGMGFGFEDGENGPTVNEEELGDVNETNIAFTKDAIVETLANLGDINKKYYDNTEIYIRKLLDSIPKLDERIMNFQKVYERGDVEFTNKTISNATILAHIAYDKEFRLREVLNRIKDYTTDSNDVAKLILHSPFKDLENAFLSKNFVPKGQILEYKRRLPGFNIASVSLPEYNNYFKTSPLEYQYYTLKENNPSDIYDINPVSITDEKDIEFYLKNLKDTILELAVSVDILRALLIEFRKYMDELKIVRVGVEEDEYEKLSELGLDDKVQQFILFKLVVEIISVNINVTTETITGFLEVMDESLKLKPIEGEEKKSDSEESGGVDWDSDSNDDSDDDDDDSDDDEW